MPAEIPETRRASRCLHVSAAPPRARCQRGGASRCVWAKRGALLTPPAGVWYRGSAHAPLTRLGRAPGSDVSWVRAQHSTGVAHRCPLRSHASAGIVTCDGAATTGPVRTPRPAKVRLRRLPSWMEFRLAKPTNVAIQCRRSLCKRWSTCSRPPMTLGETLRLPAEVPETRRASSCPGAGLPHSDWPL
jgi:hypothetical protein